MVSKHYNSSVNFLILIALFIYSQSLAIEEAFSELHKTLIKDELSSSKSFHGNNVANSQGNISRFNRQLDSDVESRFHVTINTIIRTGESRILGAKYLNETVLPNNHDCLTWCLETPNCNAVVYEEKNVHSCYMFDCGSPSTFLCKFTPHNNFVSSVLKITQHSYDLQHWGNEAKHEKELNTSPPPYPEGATPETAPKPRNATANRCHHYQFQCINSSECIAIYNVCDGIPQCPDGSDESVDLKCHMKELPDSTAKTQDPVEPPHPPETKITHSPQQPPVPPKVHTPQTNERQRVPSNKAGYRHMGKSIWMPDEQSSRSDYYQNNEDPDGLGSPFKHAHSQFVAANDPHVQSLNRWSNDYDQPYEGNYQRAEDQYLANPLSPEYGSYRQEDVPYWTNQEAENTYPVEEFPQSSLNKPEIVYPEPKRPTLRKPVEQARRYPAPRQPPYAAYEEPEGKHYRPDVYSNEDLIRASLANQLPMELDRPHHVFQYEKHKEEMPRVQSKNKEDAEARTVSSTPAQPVKHHPQRTVLDFQMSVAELYQATRTHSQEANSAILALVMGLTITVLLFVFLACRIKTIRKRMSRKGRPLAHDADYLVNGMYL